MLQPLQGSDKLQSILSVDPLAEAEKLTGKSYKDSKATQSLGFAMGMSHNDAKRRMLEEAGDTAWGTTLGQYISIVAGIGFQEVYREEFESSSSKQTECLYVFYRKPGQLLVFDTYRGCGVVNGGNVHYNWVPKVADYPLDITSTSSWMWRNEEDKQIADERWSETRYLEYDSDEYKAARARKKEWHDKVLASGGLLLRGDHDCREAIVHNLTRLEQYGKFVEPWESAPFIWLLHHQDTEAEGFDYKAITQGRIANLPEFVRVALGVAVETAEGR